MRSERRNRPIRSFASKTLHNRWIDEWKDQAPKHRYRMSRIAGLASPSNGFRPPTSSTTYTPNQFFDVVLPHVPLAAVSALSPISFRKTLGWSDEQGNPQNPQPPMSAYRELIESAGISRGAIKEAIAGSPGQPLHPVHPGSGQATPSRTRKATQPSTASNGMNETSTSLLQEDFNGFFSGKRKPHAHPQPVL
jgi:hypothetical protein